MHYVGAAEIETTMKRSVADNILDTKMEEATVKGGIVRVGLVHRKNAEAAALMHEDLTEIYQIIEGSGTDHLSGIAGSASVDAVKADTQRMRLDYKLSASDA